MKAAVDDRQLLAGSGQDSALRIRGNSSGKPIFLLRIAQQLDGKTVRDPNQKRKYTKEK
jgi:hypothetical protein